MELTFSFLNYFESGRQFQIEGSFDYVEVKSPITKITSRTDQKVKIGIIRKGLGNFTTLFYNYFQCLKISLIGMQSLNLPESLFTSGITFIAVGHKCSGCGLQ